MKRDYYGVILKGCSGYEIIHCAKRSDADRVRRVIRQWIQSGEWTGCKTLKELAYMAIDTPLVSTQNIINKFKFGE